MLRSILFLSPPPEKPARATGSNEPSLYPKLLFWSQSSLLPSPQLFCVEKYQARSSPHFSIFDSNTFPGFHSTRFHHKQRVRDNVVYRTPFLIQRRISYR